MEPIAAFALAGNVLQFTEFASKLLKDVWQILSRGQLKSDAEAAVNAEKMIRLMEVTALETSCQEFHTKIHDDLPQLIEGERMDKADQALCSACQDCLTVASDFLAVLEEVKVQSKTHQNGHRRKSKKKQARLKMDVIYAIFLRVWKKDKIDDMSALLRKASEFVQSSFLVSISTRLDFMMAQQSERFRKLSLDNKMIIASLLSGHQTASRQLESQVQALSMLLSRVEHVIGGLGQGPPVLIKDVLNDNTHIPRKEHSQIVRIATSERQQRHSVGREILKDLQFKISRPRYDEVPEAHEDTFHWIFEQPDEDALKASKRIWSDFTGWLRCGSGVYWVSGKPASGKSTLMKYIVSRERTHELLQDWSANFPDTQRNHLCTAKFFFWLSSGDKNQSSQVGLLRSILYEICSEYPQLLPTAFPDLWSKRYYQRVRAENENADDNVGVGYRSLPVSWSSSTLKEALHRIASQTQYPIQLCLFIDGLDEYEGDNTEIARLFKAISSFENIKCCLSSRPYRPFIQAFRGAPSLRLQDFTAPDIARFVSGRLEGDVRWDEIARGQQVAATELVDEIVSCAQGVFLWVKLVVESLLQGRGNGDGIAELKKRLRDFPTELSLLYDKMLRVDNIYKDDAAKIFRSVYEASELEAPMTRLTLLQLHTAIHTDIKEALVMHPGHLDQSQIDWNSQEMAAKIIVRCGGLLEIQQQASMEEASCGLFVSYLHRTVKEYLQSRTHQDGFLFYQDETQDFDALQGVLAGYILHLNMELNSKVRLTPQQPTEDVIRTALRCLSKLQYRQNTLELHNGYTEICLRVFHLIKQLSWSREEVKAAFPPTRTREFIATESCLWVFLRYLLLSKSIPTAQELDVLLETGIISKSILEPEMAKVLMEFSPDVDAAYTKWLSFLTRLRNFDLSHTIDILRFFVANGKVVKEEDLEGLKSRLPLDLAEEIEKDEELQRQVHRKINKASSSSVAPGLPSQAGDAASAPAFGSVLYSIESSSTKSGRLHRKLYDRLHRIAWLRRRD